MKRMLVPEYRRHAFVGKPPTNATIARWIKQGDLPGEQIGKTWVVFVDDNGEPLRTTGNALADSALSRWQDQQTA